MITPELKDRILNDLVSKGIHLAQDIHEAQKDYLIPSDYLELILDQFEQMGLIELDKFFGGVMHITLKAAAFDLASRGGFTIQEEIFQKTYDKLYFEIESLRKDFPERAERFTTTLANLATIALACGWHLK